MSLEALNQMPEEFAAGTTLKVRRSYTDYPADEGWVVTFYFLGAASFSGAAAADGADHVLTLAATDTDDYTPGSYTYQVRAAKAGEVKDVENGVITITPDISQVGTAASDQRSQNRIILDNLRACLAGKATSDQLNYTVKGRQLEKYSWDELIQAEMFYAARVKAEVNKARRAAGIKTGTGRLRPVFE